MKQVHLIISGDVQGVGFRAWVLRQARELELVGWVKNRQDRTVELEAEGQKKDLEELVKRCQPFEKTQGKHGPGPPAGGAWVEKVDVQWSDASGEFVSFEVVY